MRRIIEQNNSKAVLFRYTLYSIEVVVVVLKIYKKINKRNINHRYIFKCISEHGLT